MYLPEGRSVGEEAAVSIDIEANAADIKAVLYSHRTASSIISIVLTRESRAVSVDSPIRWSDCCKTNHQRPARPHSLLPISHCQLSGTPKFEFSSQDL